MGKRHKPEEIIAKLRQVDVMTAQGTTVADAVRSIGVTEVTYYRWRQEYGGTTTPSGRTRRAATGRRHPRPSRGRLWGYHTRLLAAAPMSGSSALSVQGRCRGPTG